MHCEQFYHNLRLSIGWHNVQSTFSLGTVHKYSTQSAKCTVNNFITTSDWVLAGTMSKARFRLEQCKSTAHNLQNAL